MAFPSGFAPITSKFCDPESECLWDPSRAPYGPPSQPALPHLPIETILWPLGCLGPGLASPLEVGWLRDSGCYIGGIGSPRCIGGIGAHDFEGKPGPFYRGRGEAYGVIPDPFCLRAAPALSVSRNRLPHRTVTPNPGATIIRSAGPGEAYGGGQVRPQAPKWPYSSLI